MTHIEATDQELREALCMAYLISEELKMVQSLRERMTVSGREQVHLANAQHRVMELLNLVDDWNVP